MIQTYPKNDLAANLNPEEEKNKDSYAIERTSKEGIYFLLFLTKKINSFLKRMSLKILLLLCS